MKNYFTKLKTASTDFYAVIKLKTASTDLYAIIKSYLLHRTFRVKFGEVIKHTQLKKINSVPQSNVLGSFYLLYTADFPVALGSTTVTYRRQSYTCGS